ncbi:MAG: Eco57I restriction-modification methylase domain-containing protein [Armatimonadota bacterium]
MVETARYDASLSPAERKRHGVFYTPEPVVRYLCRATAPACVVADLSCGDGAFLIEAARAGCTVMGIDRDARALETAAGHLSGVPEDRRHLIRGDGLQPSFPLVPDVVLGNPPYLEAKKADKRLKRRCRRLFPAIARGGFDIFLGFLQAGLDLLPPGGRLGYILPNKVLAAAFACALREELLAETTLEELIDVSDLPTFRDASVYPIMLVLRKAPPPPGHQVSTGYVTDLAQLDSGDFPRMPILQSRWRGTSSRVFWLPPVEPAGRALVDKVIGDARAVPLSSLLEIRWTLSFHRAGLRDRFIFPEPTGNNPLPLLGGKRFHGNADVHRYGIEWSGWWIDYDEARAKELGNPLPPRELFAGPKIVLAQNARRIVATLDREGYACKDTFLIGRQRDGVPLEYLLGVLNSALMSYIYSVLFRATHVGGGYLHYLATYLNDLPIIAPEHPEPICELVIRLLDSALPESERTALDMRLNEMVNDLYGLSPADREFLTAAVPSGWGENGRRSGKWQASMHVKKGGRMKDGG